MRFYTGQHAYYCGIDLHARSMYVCVLDRTGEAVAHRNLPAEPAAFLEFIQPFRPDVVVGVVGHFERAIRDLETYILRRAKQHDADMFHRLRTIQGIGKVLALTILYEVHDIERFARVQDFASYCRLVKCPKESAGKRKGSSGKKIGNVHLKWAFSEAAVLFLRANPAGQKYLARLTKKHGKGKALSILAHKLGRATYYVMRRKRSFDMNKFLAA